VLKSESSLVLKFQGIMSLSSSISFLPSPRTFTIAHTFVIVFYKSDSSSSFLDSSYSVSPFPVPNTHKEAQILDSGIKTQASQGQEGGRIFGRPSVTARYK